MSHAYLAPSAAAQWGAPGGCRAWPLMNLLHAVREETPEQREGTAAHELAATGIDRALRALPFPFDRVGQKASNGEILTQEMAEAAQVYADDVRREAVQRGVFGGEAVGVEKKVMSQRIHEHNNGTPDFWMHDARNRTLIVWDFKFGHRNVDAFENSQLMNYAGLLFDWLGIDGLTEQFYTVILKVVRPRVYGVNGPVDSWTVKATDLRPYWNDLAVGARESMADDPIARPSFRCLDCDARHACQALQYAAGSAMDYARSTTTQNLPEHALALELGWLDQAKDLIEARLTGLQQEAQQRIDSGKVVPGYGTDVAHGRPAWSDPEQIIAIGTAFGLDLRRTDPVTPSQAKKAGLPAEVVQHNTHKPTNGRKLYRVKSNQVKKVFSQ